MKIDSLIVKGIEAKDDPYGAVVPPVYLASTYSQESLKTENEYMYARGGNPTRGVLESLFAKIEGVRHAFAFSSGMAATSAVFSLFKSGDKILLNNNVYGGTYRYATTLFPNQGIEFDLIDDFAEVRMESVAAVFVETPSNPLLRVTDLERVAKLAHANGALLIVDNTFLTPYFQNPFQFGADISVHSATKYLSGHADLLAGLVSTDRDDLAARIKVIQNTLGGILNPMDSYSLIRGIKTLSVRLDRQEENTCKIIKFLSQHPAVSKLYYPGSHSDEERKVQEKQARGNGAVISLCLDEKYDQNTFVESLHFFDLAVSLGGVESLISHPASMTHESFPKELQEKIGITKNLLRLAIGIENADDLIEDLSQAMEKSKGV